MGLLFKVTINVYQIIRRIEEFFALTFIVHDDVTRKVYNSHGQKSDIAALYSPPRIFILHTFNIVEGNIDSVIASYSSN